MSLDSIKINANSIILIIISTQIALIGSVGLDEIGLNIPLIRQILAIVSLVFIPGYLILRIVKWQNNDNVVTFLYSVGLSIGTVMAISLLINFGYHILGITRPLSLLPLLVSFSTLNLVLCLVYYLMVHYGILPKTNDMVLDTQLYLKPTFLLLTFVPFLSIIGTYVMNHYHSNIGLLLMILVIAILVVSVGFNLISDKYYPYLLFVVSISLLFHCSLISNWLVGQDILSEYYCSQFVLTNYYWDPMLNEMVNSSISSVVLGPVISLISNIDLTWVYKCIYPAIFSLVPIVLYKIYQDLFDSKVAFLSTFFFVSFFGFFQTLIELPRQQIAELFLALILLTIFQMDANSRKLKTSLLMLFGLFLVISHYSLAFIYSGLFICAGVLMYMLVYIAKILSEGPIARKQLKPNSLYGKLKENFSVVPREISSTVISYATLFILMTCVWYIYIASVPFTNGVFVLDRVVEPLISRYGGTGDIEPYAVLTYQTQYLFHMVKKYLHLFSQFCIFIGILSILYIWRRYNLKVEYVAFAIINFVILILALVVPNLAGVLNTERTYHIALIYLAPMCIIGFYIGINFVDKNVLLGHAKKLKKNATQIVSVFLVVLFLLNTGFVYELSHEPSSSYSLSEFKAMNYAVYSEEELKTIFWLQRSEMASPLYADSMIRESAERLEQKMNAIPFSMLQKEVDDEYGVFLRQYNVLSGEIRTGYGETYIMNVENLVNDKCEIYSGGTTKVYI